MLPQGVPLTEVKVPPMRILPSGCTRMQRTLPTIPVPMLKVAELSKLLVRAKNVREGAARGAAWVAVVGLSQFLLSLGNGVVPVFGLLGTWVYLLAIVLGPVLAGLLGARRTEPVAAPV